MYKRVEVKQVIARPWTSFNEFHLCFYSLMGILLPVSFRWVQLLEMAQEALRRKRVGSKWATLRADDVGEALGLPKTQAR